MKFFVFLTVVLLLACPAAAWVKVDHEAGVDFESYRTYAWKPGVDAARPEIQASIVRAVDRQLEAQGLRKVRDRRADVYVVTHAIAEMSTGTQSNYVNLDRYDVGVLTADIVMTTTGTLTVDLIDGKSERPVWRGMATEVMGDPSAAKLFKKIEKVTRKMFKSFPPSR